MTLLSAEQLEKLATQPIPGNSPAGENARLDAEFEAIEREIAKLDSLTAAEPVRWQDVLVHSQTILEHQSKDFLVACYLTRALCEIQVMEGLQQGLTLARGLVDHFWEQAWPPVRRVRGRAQSFEWLVEKCNPLLDNYRPQFAHLESLRALEETLAGLDSILVEKMAENAPNLMDMRQRLRRLYQGLEAEQQTQHRHQEIARASGSRTRPENQNSVTSLQQSEPLINAQVNAPSGIDNERDVMAVFRACQEPLRAVSQYLRGKKLTDPEAYRINRFVTWLGISQLPPAKEGLTQIKPVSREKLDACQALYAEQRWSELLPEVENSVARAPFWLDGHRLAWESLDALGADSASEAVMEGLKGFISRFPAVLKYRFSDGSGFADDVTRQWIDRVVNATRQNGVGTEIVVDQAGLSAGWHDAYEQAAALAREKKLRDAIALFQQGCNRSTSLREQTLWRFNQARFCFESGLRQLAVPLLENLDRQLTENGVEDWEPQVTTKVLELLLRCYCDGITVPESRVEALRARLCKHDLALAFDLSN